MNVPVDAFRRQIDWLSARGEILSLEEALRRRGEADSGRYFVITFDDGYADVFDNAFPLLEQRQIPFTLYLTSGPIDAPDDFPQWPGRPLTWDQTKVMAGSGLMTMGAHTHTHPDLRYVDGRAAVEEVELSNELIQHQVGVMPRHFTYPKGWWSPTADPVIRRSYSSATLGMGRSITADSDVFTLHRVSVLRSDGFGVFRRKMVTGGRTEARARRLRHRYTGP